MTTSTDRLTSGEPGYQGRDRPRFAPTAAIARTWTPRRHLALGRHGNRCCTKTRAIPTMTQSDLARVGVTVAHVMLCDCPTCIWYEESWGDIDPYEDTPNPETIVVMPTDGGLYLLSEGMIPRYRVLDTDDSTFVGPWHHVHFDSLFAPMQ